jgi:hypothetical protein
MTTHTTFLKISNSPFLCRLNQAYKSAWDWKPKHKTINLNSVFAAA